jgi:membrane-associated phospholipid phosphatase
MEGLQVVDALFAPALAALLVLTLTPRRAYAQLLALAALLAAVVLAKRVTGVLRPDGSDRLSFPSGHAATAFFAAGLCGWHPLATLWAALVAAARVANRRHTPLDVVVGAAAGAAFAQGT